MSRDAKLTEKDRWLAAEYALGVLDREAMAEASVRCSRDHAFKEAVESWNAQLAPMLDEVNESMPSSAVWKHIENQVFPPDRAAQGEGAGIWKFLSALFGSAAVASFAFLIYVTGGDFAGRELEGVKLQLAQVENEKTEIAKTLAASKERAAGLSNDLQTARARVEDLRAETEAISQRLASLQTDLEDTTNELGVRSRQLAQVQLEVQQARPLVASLTQSGDAPAFVAQFDPLKKALLIRTANTDDDEKVPEVWLIPGEGERKGEVLSLGVMDEQAPDELPITDDFLALMGEGGTLAITMEPPGGAPNGVATGPVIALGQLQSF